MDGNGREAVVQMGGRVVGGRSTGRDSWRRHYPHTGDTGLQLIRLGVLAAQAKRYFEELFHIDSRLLKQITGLDERLTALESQAGSTNDR